MNKKERPEFYIINSVNKSNINFKDIVLNLDLYSKIHEDEMKQRARVEEALILKHELEKQPILLNLDSYDSKFESIGNFDIDDVSDVLHVCDEIVNDVRHARNWLDLYLDFSKKLFNSLDTMTDKKLIRENLSKLGKAILGRAVELCPKDTGNLRRSGLLVETKDSVIIGFACDYASYVHEDLNNHHDVGRAKFLEIAVQEFFPDRRVWVENHGYNGISVILSINYPYVTYKHYD